MSTRSADAESRDPSPDREDSPGKRPSKKRKVLSCYACRNRKMKCDRVYPICGRCQKTGRGDQCTYDPRLIEELIGSTAGADAIPSSFNQSENGRTNNGTALNTSEALQWKLRLQDRKIHELEQKLAAKDATMNPSEYIPVQARELDRKEEMMFRGKGFKTSFHGATSVMSTIAQYREMQAFTREALTTDHSIRRIRTDFKTFRDRRKMMLKQMGTRTFGMNEEVFAVIPNRQVLDVQVALYFQTCETTYRVLHEPSFWREYHSFWNREVGDDSQAGFATILVLIVAVTKCLSPKDDVFEGDTTADRQAASNLVDICDAWNARQPRKRLTLQFFQIQCLLLLAKRINCVQLKQDWLVSGDLVRLAIASGMHRDTALLATGKVSAYEKEMKKRLWVTIVELELQASLECGLQPSTNGLYWDTPPPSNLPDESLSSDMDGIPNGHPDDHFTPSSYGRIAYKSLPLRIHLTQLLNDPSEKIPYEEVLQYDAQIHQLLVNLPVWRENRATLTLFLLQLQLQQFLLLLHKPFAKASHAQSRYMNSFAQCVAAAGAMTIAHDDLISKGILLLNHMRNDAVRVSLTLSEAIYHNCVKEDPVNLSAPPAATDSEPANFHTHFADLPKAKEWLADLSLTLPMLPRQPSLARTLCTSGIETLQLAVQLCEQKVMRLGTAYMEYGLLSAAIDMLPPLPGSSKPPTTSIAHITTTNDDIESRCRRTLDRFQTVAFRVLAMQKDPCNTFATSLRTTMQNVSPSDDRNSSLGTAPTGSDFGTTPSNIPISVPGLDLGNAGGTMLKDPNGAFDNLQDMQVDMGSWTFPDFWAFDLGGDL